MPHRNKLSLPPEFELICKEDTGAELLANESLDQTN
jgi:hypothetical protein